MRLRNKPLQADVNNLEANSRWSMKKQVLAYTGLFLVAAALVYAAFFFYSKTLLKAEGNVDGLMQHYPSYTKIKRVLSQGGESWSWDVGLGASFFDTFKGKLTNPLTYILIAFPQKYIDVAYDFVTILRQYLAGVAFILFGRELKLNNEQSVLGAFCYAFSGWAIFATLTQGTFTNALILFPILIMGTERILNGKSPVVFVVAEVLFLSSTIIWAYAAGIFSILYFLMRYPYYYGKNGIATAHMREADTHTNTHSQAIKTFGRHFGGFVLDGIIGLMISAIYVISILYSTTSAVTNSEYDSDIGIFYSLRTYFLMPTSLVSITEAHESYSLIFASILVAILFPLIIRNAFRKKSTPAIMTIFCLVIGLFPITGKIMNGMSYSVGRWYFIVTFFLVWAAMECLDHQILSNRKQMFLLFGWWFFLCVWLVAICMVILRLIAHNVAWETLVSLCMMFALLCALFIREVGVAKGTGNSKIVRLWNAFFNTIRGIDVSKVSRRAQRGMSVIIIVLMVTNLGLDSWILLTGINRINQYLGKGEASKTYSEYVQRVTPEIQSEDTSFYRTDQLDDGFVKSNANLVFGARSIYEYFSTLSSDWLYFNKVMGNNAGYNRRMVTLSNDNRSGLDYLLGVKYFLRDANYKKNEKLGYVPYGFEYWKTIDGVEVYRNKHSIGIGTGYSQYITKSELMKYSALEREQIMLQAVVVDDDDAKNLTGVKHATATDLKTDVQSLTCSITSTHNVTIDGVDGGDMVVAEGENTDNLDPDSNEFTIHVSEKLKNVQIVVSFQGMDREKYTWDQNLAMRGETVEGQNYSKFKEYLIRQDFSGGTSFVVTASKGDRSKTAACYKDGDTGLNDVADYNMNLGYYDSFSGDIKIHLNNAGHYTYDSIKVYAIPTTIYDENATKLDDSKFNLTSFDNDTVKGTVNNDSDTIMYFSILNNAGWHVYVDGEEADKIKNVNLAFAGVKVSKGKHKITLEYDYPGLKSGLIVTGLGIASLVAVVLRRRKLNPETIE